MKLPLPMSIESRILTGFIGSLVLLVIASALTYRLNSDFAEATRYIGHSQNVRAALSDVYDALSDAESAQRNYLLTGDVSHKADYQQAASRLDSEEAQLWSLIADDSDQQKRYLALIPYLGQRMSLLAQHLAIYERTDLDTVRRQIGADVGIEAKRQVQMLAARMDNAERVVLESRQASLDVARRRSLYMMFATPLVAGGLLLALYLGIRRQMAARSAAERAFVVAREAADSANRAKSTFLATMSHEIRTPMNGMLGMLELLSLTRLDGEQRTTLEIVRASSKSLLRIIDDVLDFSKIEAGKLEVRPEVASIRSVIEDVHNIYSGNASSKGVLIRRIADPDISPALIFDPLRLRQILNNLVSNALKFTAHGSIEIRAELVERLVGVDRVRFSVTDTGSGISTENQKRLFEAFSQVDDELTRKAGGTGLGLTICRRLASMMGGSIEMRSELGKGTTMILVMSMPIADPSELPKFDLPAVRMPLTTPRRVAPTIAQAVEEGSLLLLVDDHPTNRSLLTRQANTLGYASESAENGLVALTMWKTGRFSIVVTDCNMPEMDGYQLARAIRALEAESGAKRCPIIACTANALAGEAEHCFAAGMDDYLVKPVLLPKLLHKLDQWLPIPHATSADCAATPVAAVDRSSLAEISGGDTAIEHDILMDFRRVNDEDTAVLERAVASDDSTQVTYAVHRILGASRMVGALVLAGVCERIEHASRAGDLTLVAAHMPALRFESSRLNAYLDAL